jgi:hypothetical protein
MRFLTHLLTDVLGIEGCVSGQYTSAPIVTTAPSMPPSSGRPRLPRTRTRRRYSRRATQHAQRPRLAFWARQLGMYLLALLLMKLAVLVLFALFPFLITAGGALLDLFGEHKNAQVLFSMSLFPLVMNVLQFWLIDTLLRHNPHTSKYVGDADEEEALGNESRASESTDYRASTDYRGSTDFRNSTDYAEGTLYRQGSASTAHLVGDASESEGEDETPRAATTPAGRAQDGAAAADDGHAYPPSIGSRGSRSRPSSPPAPPPAMRASASSLDDLRVQASRTLSDEGEEEAWDAWDDEADNTGAAGGGAGKKAHARENSAGSFGLETQTQGRKEVKRD